MGKKRYVPRWIYEEFTVSASAKRVRLPASVFANNEPWPMDLHWFSILGATPRGGGGDVNVGHNMLLEVGITGKSDINLEPTYVEVIASDSSFRELSNADDPGLLVRFPHPIEFGPEETIVAQVQNDDASGGGGTVRNASIVFNGLQDFGHGGLEPMQLAGTGPDELEYQNSYTFDSPDLRNSGDNTAYLLEMLIQGGYYMTHNVHFEGVRWRINPATGVPWMPNPRLIPAGSIAPFNRYSFDGYRYPIYPEVYVFPKGGSRLNPRQAVQFEVTDLSAVKTRIHVCLFGVLEVE